MDRNYKSHRFGININDDRYEVSVTVRPETYKLKVHTYQMTCGACPSQWNLTLHNDEREIYVRYRWGHLSLSFGVRGETLLDASKVGDGMDGVMNLDTLQRLTGSVLNWSNAVEYVESEED